MLVARNLKYVETQKRNSRLRTLIGVLFFVAGTALLLLNSVQFLLIAYMLVIVGFVFFNTGLQGVAKWSRRVRNDQLIDDELRRLSDRYTLIHYLTLGKRTPEHVLVHETGVVTMTTKEVIGRVDVRGKNYQKKGQSIIGRFLNMSGPQLGQPATENALDREALLRAVAAEAKERDWPIDWPVDGLVVFTAPRLSVSVADNADPPAVKLADLLGWVQAHSRGMPIVLTSDVRQEITDFLIAQGGAVSEGRLDPRGAAEAETSASARRTPTRARATTPQQVVKARTERERQARARVTTPATAPAATGNGETVVGTGTTRRLGRRRIVEVVEPEGERETRPAAPLVPSGSMARVKRRDRGPR